MDSSDPVVRARLTELTGPAARQPTRHPAEPTPEAARGATAPASGLRSRAVASALTAYTAAHGHPLEHGAGSLAGARRWATGRRTLVVAVAALVVLVSAVVLIRFATDPPSTLVPVDAGPATAGGDSGPVRDSDGSDPSPGTDGAGPGADDAGTPAGRAGETDTGPPTGRAAPEDGTVVVHVVGQVVTPGLVELPEGARVADAVAAAGGLTESADTAGINLARPAVDGEQVRVPAPGEDVPSSAGTQGVGGGDAAVPVDLNGADVTALDALPGIGPVLAERIVGWRAEHGRFSSVEELTEVSGIGPAMLERLRDRVRVG